jgi:hypothetical protein
MREWEIKQRTYSENKLPISIKDFKECRTDEQVKERFNELLKSVASQELFRKKSV